MDLIKKSQTELIDEIKYLKDTIDHLKKKIDDESLSKYESVTRTLLDSITESIIFQTVEGIILDMNETAAERLDSSREIMVGTNIFNYFERDVSEFRKSKIEEAVAKKQTIHFHDERNGIYFDTAIFPMIDNGKVSKIIVFGKDITEKVRTLGIIKESEERYVDFLEHSPYAIFIYYENKVVYSNKAGLKLLGFESTEELYGMNVTEFVHKDSLKTVQERNIKIESGLKYSPPAEERILRKDGTILDVEVVALPFNFKGETAIQVIVNDITDRKKAEEALRTSEEYNRAINEHSPIGITVRSCTGKLLNYNNSWKDIWGLTQEEIDTNITNGDNEENFDEQYEYFGKWLEEVKNIYKTGGKLFIPELKTYLNKNGTAKWITNYLYAIKNLEGKVDRVIILTEDITKRKIAEESLVENQRTLSTLMHNLPGIAYRCKNDKYWTMEFISDGCRSLTGYSSSDLIDNRTLSYSEIICNEYKQYVWDSVQQAISERRPFELVYKIRTKDKKEKWVWEKGEGIYTDRDEPLALEGFITDITEMKQNEDTVRKLSRAVEQSPASIVITDLIGNIEYVNPKFTEITGYSLEEAIGQNPRILKSGENPRELYKNLWDTITSGNEWHGLFLNKKKDNTLFWESASISAIKNEEGKITHFCAVKEDITEQKTKDEKLQNSLKEKELMLREIHHRVKNNLQIISSLLKLQATYITDPTALEYFRISQDRVKSMALIHQQLYRSTDLSSINFGDYLRHLTTHLFQAYGVNENNIRLNIDAKNIYIGIDTAIPCGLLINELISNSLKHAFPNNRKGRIIIRMELKDENTYLLTVSDNGVGFPEDIDFRNTKSLGMQLVITLTDQIDGKIELIRDSGTIFNISFISINYKKRV